jgi:hypothetical protein
MRRQPRTQMDLFVPLAQPADINGVERQKALALLRTLLMEAATKLAKESQVKKGADNE